MRSIAVLILLLSISCRKDSTPTPETVIPSKATFTGIINQVNYAMTESDSGYVNLDSTFFWETPLYGSSAIDSTTLTLGMYFGGFRVNDPPPEHPKNSIQINFIKHFSNSELKIVKGKNTLSGDLIANILATGPKAYSLNKETQDGVIINWLAANEFWSSSTHWWNGRSPEMPVYPDLSSASFKIDRSIRLNPGSRTIKQYVETSFNCKLYNRAGDSIVLSNGKLKGTYLN